MNDLATMSLSRLCRIANTKAGEARACAKSSVEAAIESGRALLIVKEKVPHGGFGKWVEDNFEYSQRTCQQFMKLAKAQSTALLENSKDIKQALIAVSEAERADLQATPCHPTEGCSESVEFEPDGTSEEDEVWEDVVDEYEEQPAPKPKPILERRVEPEGDPVVERARAKVPELIRNLKLQLGNLGLGGRFDAELDAIEEAAR